MSPDGRYAVVTNNGLAKPSLLRHRHRELDGQEHHRRSTTRGTASRGIPTARSSTRRARRRTTSRNSASPTASLTRARTFALPAQTGETFAGGLADQPGRPDAVRHARLRADAVGDRPRQRPGDARPSTLPAEPYTCVVSADGRMVYVSLWGGARVAGRTAADSLMPARGVRDRRASRTRWCCRRDGKRLFVACGNSASVWVFDTFSGERDRADFDEPVSRTRRRPSTPNSLALSPDGQHAARRQRRQQRRRGRRRQQRRPQLRRRLHPDRLVSDRRRSSAATASRSSC